MKSHSKQARHLDSSFRRGQSPNVLWTGYSARAAAELVDLTESMVRACIRDGLFEDGHDVFPLRLSFQDLSLLKTVRRLSHGGVAPKRVRRQLSKFKRTHRGASSLSAIAFDSYAGQVVVRGQEQSWHAESGQLLFEFSFDQEESGDHSIPNIADRIASELDASADDWMSRAIALEENDPKASLAAYEKVLELRSESTEALVNKGRIHAEMGDVDKAAICFRRALDIDPDDPTIVYNLGVIAQDIGKDEEAISLYQRSLELDEELAEAHYNLATIFDRAGETQIAIRHIHAYRKLTR